MFVGVWEGELGNGKCRNGKWEGMGKREWISGVGMRYEEEIRFGN